MNKKLKLIEGTFTNEEAKEILVNIFSEKIKFHQAKNFSSKERTGKEDKIAVKKMPALKKELLKMDKILSSPKAKKLTIISEINISLSDD